jgi:hypothetical protein
MNSKTALALLPLTWLAAAPALAQPAVATQPSSQLPYTLSIDAETQWHLDRNYRLFGADRADSVGGFSASVQLSRLAGGTLELGAGYHYNTSRGTWAAANEASLDEYTPSLSALLRWAPYRWLEPHVRVAAEITRANLTLTMSNGRYLEDSVWAPAGSAGLGLRLRTGVLTTGLRNGTLGVAGALIIEGGFRMGVPYTFDVSSPAPADRKLADDRIPTSSTSVGTLERSQPYLRLSFALLI